MTKQEIIQILIERPEILQLVKSYQEAEKRNPRALAQVTPIIIKMLTDREQDSKVNYNYTVVFNRSDY